MIQIKLESGGKVERIEFNSDYDACRVDARRSFSTINSVEQTTSLGSKGCRKKAQFGFSLFIKVVLMAETKERKRISLAEQCI